MLFDALATPIYVDPLMTCLMSKRWRWPKSCHMFIDTRGDLDELHEFAQRLGLKRAWFQHKPGGLPHYDLNAAKRCLAVAHGAFELDRRDTVMVLRRWRELQGVPQ